MLANTRQRDAQRPSDVLTHAWQEGIVARYNSVDSAQQDVFNLYVNWQAQRVLILCRGWGLGPTDRIEAPVRGFGRVSMRCWLVPYPRYSHTGFDLKSVRIISTALVDHAFIDV